jgi:SpoVK/Ycf46/Vps4 family AAA+-type ATPase
LLLLDEFDAIAKRRDDATEIGELKRIVNVLLKELEEWPLQSVLVAATNHPELLDRAIARRFDLVLDLPLPRETERAEILKRAARRFGDSISEPMLRALACALEGASGSDLDSLMNAAVRHHLATGDDIVRSVAEEFRMRLGERLNRQKVGDLLRSMQASVNGSFTVRELAELFGKSASTIQHHLKKEAQHG